MKLSPEQRISLIRECCKDSFWYFIEEFWETVPGAGKMVPNWHMRFLADEMERIFRRVYAGKPAEYDEVINISPGTSKSTICSILFHPWTWTIMPSCRHLNASHTESLVLDLANKSRQVIKSEKYRKAFPEVVLRTDQDAKGDFANTAGGERYSCTVGGKSPLGRHAHILTGDDLLDPQKALSEAELKTAADFISNGLPTRMVDKSVSVVFLIMQRLGKGDPTDVMLDIAKREHARPCRHIRLPCDDSWEIHPPELKRMYVDGLMDPVRLPRAVLNAYRARGEYTFAGQFGQSPMSPGGGLFKIDYFNKRVKAAPYNARRIRFWDRGASISESACYTAGLLMAKTPEAYYIEHLVHGRWEPHERNRIMRATALRDNARYGPRNAPQIWVEAEGGSSGRDAWQGIVRALEGFVVKEDRVTGAKDVRAEPLAVQMASGNVFIVEDGSYDINKMIEEFVLFRPEPGKKLGRRKDIVDSACLLYSTIIDTKNGPKKIGEIKAGEFVLTRDGYKEVLWSGETKRVSELVSILFSNGSTITGTLDHLVWTHERGFVRLDSLEETDRVLLSKENQWESFKNGSIESRENTFANVGVENSLKSNISIKQRESQTISKDMLVRSLIQRQSNLMGFSTTDGQGNGIFGEKVDGNLFMLRYGNSNMEASPMVMKFITRMGTTTTTTLRILRPCLSKIIEENIQETGKPQNIWSIWTESGVKHQNGINQRKDGNGTGSMVENVDLELENLNNSNVLSVEKSLNLKEQLLNIVLQFVMTDLDLDQERRTSTQKNAHFANSNSKDQEEKHSAQANVRCPLDGQIPVYDLNVRDAHEFFANGILVHNSGAFNLLVGKGLGVNPPLRTFTFRNGKRKKQLQVVISSREDLANTIIEDRAILISLSDQGQGIPIHAITHLLDSKVIEFCDIDSKDYQEKWNEPVYPYNKMPEDLIMTPEDGKAFWSFVTKRRDPPVEVIVIQDDGDGDRRAESMAIAVCELFHIPKEHIQRLGNPENIVIFPTNKHIYDMTKSCRHSVIV